MSTSTTATAELQANVPVFTDATPAVLPVPQPQSRKRKQPGQPVSDPTAYAPADESGASSSETQLPASKRPRTCIADYDKYWHVDGGREAFVKLVADKYRAREVLFKLSDVWHYQYSSYALALASMQRIPGMCTEDLCIKDGVVYFTLKTLFAWMKVRKFQFFKTDLDELLSIAEQRVEAQATQERQQPQQQQPDEEEDDTPLNLPPPLLVTTQDNVVEDILQVQEIELFNLRSPMRETTPPPLILSPQDNVVEDILQVQEIEFFNLRSPLRETTPPALTATTTTTVLLPNEEQEEEGVESVFGVNDNDDILLEETSAPNAFVNDDDDHKKHEMYLFIQAMDKKANDLGTPYVLLLDQHITTKIGWSQCHIVKAALREMLSRDPSHFERFCKVRRRDRERLVPRDRTFDRTNRRAQGH
jgi:hypothetical protein